MTFTYHFTTSADETLGAFGANLPENSNTSPKCIIVNVNVWKGSERQMHITQIWGEGEDWYKA